MCKTFMVYPYIRSTFIYIYICICSNTNYSEFVGIPHLHVYLYFLFPFLLYYSTPLLVPSLSSTFQPTSTHMFILLVFTHFSNSPTNLLRILRLQEPYYIHQFIYILSFIHFFISILSLFSFTWFFFFYIIPVYARTTSSGNLIK